MKINKYQIKYEILNMINNGYAFFFGCLLPICLFHLIRNSALQDVPKKYIGQANTQILLGFSLLIPLATIFLSFASNLANEKDKNIPERLALFGLSHNSILLSKMISNYLFLTGCYLIYCLMTLPFAKFEGSKGIYPLLVFIILIYVFSGVLMILAYGIANIFKGFGITYGVSMGIYFGLMILSGNMGVSIDTFPSGLRFIADLSPLTHLSEPYMNFWLGKSYNFGPLVQSFIFFTCISVLLNVLANNLNKTK